MSKLLFHGDDSAGSRSGLFQALEKEKASGRDIQVVDGLKVSPKDLESYLASANLFSSTAIVLENLGSRPLSKDKKAALALIAGYRGDKNILLWEKKELTKSQINAFGKDVIAKSSKIPAAIFQFLDAVRPGNVRETLKLLTKTAVSAETGFIFVMLCRHVSDLIIAQSGDTSRLIPFKRSRLVSQASAFTPETLRSLHTSLLSIDRAVKTGRTKLDYMTHLELVLAEKL